MKAVKTEFNFLPSQLLEQRERRRKIIRWSPLVFGVILLMAGLFYSPVYLADKYQAEIDQINEEYSHLIPAVTYYNKANELQTRYENSRQAIVEIKKKRVPLVEIIDGISSMVPPGVKVTRLAVNAAQGVTLTFETDSALPTAQFIVGLRTLPFFEEVEPQQVPLRGSTEEVILELPFKGVKPAENLNN